jgi:hypothetical protein
MEKVRCTIEGIAVSSLFYFKTNPGYPGLCCYS